MKGYVYILKCHDGSYYTGSSTNLKKRIANHRKGRVKYTKSRLPVKLVFVKEFSTLGEAKSFENKIKSWKKRKSIEKAIAKADNLINHCRVV